MTITCDLTVIGGGLTGLIIARDMAKRGQDVVVLEARERLGGRIYSLKLPNVEKILDLGLEWFDADRHRDIMHEIETYGLAWSKSDPIKTIWTFGDRDESLTEGIEPFLEKDLDEYNRVCQLIERDAQRLDFLNGHDPIDEEDLDTNFDIYITNTLQTKGLIRDYFISRATTLMGAPAHTFPAISILRNIIGFHGIENFFNTTFCRLNLGMGELIRCIAEDIIKYNGKIILNSPVISITNLKTNDSSTNDDNHCGKVVTLNGIHCISKAISVTVPLQCLGSIQFVPRLPEIIYRLVLLCNVNRNHKYFVVASGISKRINRVISGNQIFESQILCYLKDKIISSPIKKQASFKLVTETNGIVDENLIIEESINCSATTNIDKLISQRYNNCSNCDTINDSFVYQESLNNITTSIAILSINCENEEIIMLNFRNLKQSLRLHHPVLKTIDHVISYDFNSDPWSRGNGQFVPKAGISRIYSECCKLVFTPWLNNKRLIICNGDFNDNGWMGWIEGSVASGYKGAKYMMWELCPPETVVMRKFMIKK